MNQSIAAIALVVRDYDEAIRFFVGTLGFTLVEDTIIEAQNKRWVIVTPYMHKVHHSEWRPETDSNYSTVLSLWDRLAGSFRITVPVVPKLSRDP